MKSFRRIFIKSVLSLIGLTVLFFAGWWAWAWYIGAGYAPPELRTEKVTRATLVATINATGTLQPQDVIDIGAQVVGQIKYFGRDPSDNNATVAVASAIGLLASACVSPSFAGPFLATYVPSPERNGGTMWPALVFGGVSRQGFKLVDYNTVVDEGTVLAQLDDSKFLAAVLQARAVFHRAQANERLANSNFRNADQLVRRAEQSGMATSLQDLETARYTREAAVDTVEASKEDIQAAAAALTAAEIDLSYTVIRSTTKGVVISRRVNVGQTVVAGLSAPSLFLLAKDLRKMQVWVQVNEADIGHIKEPDATKKQEGTEVTFTVDAYPDNLFVGRVSQIRRDATMSQNVVTYTVVVDTDNRDAKTDGVGKLMPYLTANLQFRVDQRTDALTVPNAALRYRPPLTRIDPFIREEYDRAIKKKVLGVEEPAKITSDEKGKRTKHNAGTVWIEKDGYVLPIKVATGLTDGSRTEVIPSKDPNDIELTTDMSVVVGEDQNKQGSSGQASGGSVNPFAPPPVFGKKSVK